MGRLKEFSVSCKEIKTKKKHTIRKSGVLKFTLPEKVPYLLAILVYAVCIQYIQITSRFTMSKITPVSIRTPCPVLPNPSYFLNLLFMSSQPNLFCHFFRYICIFINLIFFLHVSVKSSLT